MELLLTAAFPTNHHSDSIIIIILGWGQLVPQLSSDLRVPKLRKILAHHPLKSRTLAEWERLMMSKSCDGLFLSELCTGCSVSHHAASASLQSTKCRLRIEIKGAKLWTGLARLLSLRVVGGLDKNTKISSANGSSFGRSQFNHWIIDLYPLWLMFCAFCEKRRYLPIHLARTCSVLMVATLIAAPLVDHSGANSACNDICVSLSTCKPWLIQALTVIAHPLYPDVSSMKSRTEMLCQSIQTEGFMMHQCPSGPSGEMWDTVNRKLQQTFLSFSSNLHRRRPDNVLQGHIMRTCQSNNTRYLFSWKYLLII